MENQRNVREWAVRRCPACFVGEIHFRVGETAAPAYERYHEDGRHGHCIVLVIKVVGVVTTNLNDSNVIGVQDCSLILFRVVQTLLAINVGIK